jgi:restriction system protein
LVITLVVIFVVFPAIALGRKPVDIAAGLFQLLIVALMGVAGVALLVSGFLTIARGRRLADPASFPVPEAAPLPSLPEPVRSHRPPPPPPQAPVFDWGRTIDALDWFQFEKLVAIALTYRGWQVERRGGAHADGGIDLVARKIGEPDMAVQCEHWKAWNLGVATVREFFGAMQHAGIARGMVIASKGYTDQAAELARQHEISLLDKSGLVRLLEETDCRFAPDVQALLNDPTKYCPRCESPMVMRNGSTPFWGCSRYPACRCTVTVRRTRRDSAG